MKYYKTDLLRNHIAKYFAINYAKLTNDEKGTIERIEQHIIATYEADGTQGKKLFNELLDVLEEMNDLAGKTSAYNQTIDWLINLWNEIYCINTSKEVED